VRVALADPGVIVLARGGTPIRNQNGVDQTDFSKIICSRDRRMSTPQPADDFSKGMQTIERAIIEGVRKAGRHVTTADLTWYRGRAVMPRPEMIDLQLRVGNRAAVGIFSREEIEDAADRVDHPETLRTILRIIAEASQLPP